MWIGPDPSVRAFAAAVSGYEAALRDAGIVDDEAALSWQFGQWLAADWRVSSVVGWPAHIAERFGDDEAGIAESARLMERWFNARAGGA